MPEPIENVGKEQKSATNALSRLKKKYRLDEVVKSAAGNRYLLDPKVFDKFSSVDATSDKHYLDWMLFIAAGGQEAMDTSLSLWGDAEKKRSVPQVFADFSRYNPNQAMTLAEITGIAANQKITGLEAASGAIVKATAIKDIAEKRSAILKVLQASSISPPPIRGEAPEAQAARVKDYQSKLAGILAVYKFRAWAKSERSRATQNERLEAASVLISLSKGLPMEEAEQSWKAKEEKVRSEFLIGSEDTVSKAKSGVRLFGFYYTFPGGPGVSYESIYATVAEFLTMSRQYQATEDLENYVMLDIGKVKRNADSSLTYSGKYPSLKALQEAVAVLKTLPLRKRVTTDVKFLGKGGRVGPEEKVYSDKLVDVLVPATLAASIQAGDHSWGISNPTQMSRLNYQGASGGETEWKKANAGVIDAFAEPSMDSTYFAKPRDISAIFHIKVEDLPRAVRKIMLSCPLEEIVGAGGANTAIKYVRENPVLVIGKDSMMNLSKGRETVSLDVLLRYWRRLVDHDTAYKLERSMTEAVRHIYQWAMHQDMRAIEPDPVESNLAKLKRRSLRTEAIIRARQTVQALLS